MLDEDEQSNSLKNFIENVKTKSQYVNNTFQSVKEDYRYLLLNKLDQNLVLLSLRLFILLSKSNHNEYLNILLGEFIYQIKDLRKYHQNIVAAFCCCIGNRFIHDHALAVGNALLSVRQKKGVKHKIKKG